MHQKNKGTEDLGKKKKKPPSISGGIKPYVMLPDVSKICQHY